MPSWPARRSRSRWRSRAWKTRGSASASPARGKSPVSELLELTAAAAAELVRARELDPGELFELYRARAAADELNAFTWVAEAVPAGRPSDDAPLGGVPLAVKDLFCTEGVPSQAGSRILEGYR